MAHDRTKNLRVGFAALSALLMAFGCSYSGGQASSRAPAMDESATMTSDPTANDNAPPERIQAWMDRLTVDHAYDPETGFIVARETIVLPAVLTDAPPLDEAVRRAALEQRTVIAFATADRCAPCQQYKKDALNDARVIARLGDERLIATHVEVDRQPELAEAYLGSRGIPMTYALRDGQRIAELRGQRSAEDLLAWLDEVLGG